MSPGVGRRALASEKEQISELYILLKQEKRIELTVKGGTLKGDMLKDNIE